MKRRAKEHNEEARDLHETLTFCDFLASMSKIRSALHRKPPLPESPTKFRPSRILRSSVRSLKTPSASAKKFQMTSRSLDMEESHMRPEDQSISCELRALAKMVEDGFGNTDFSTIVSPNPTSLFERGRFYEEYSARRNERLKRKMCGETAEDSSRSVLGVVIESGKKRASKKYDSVRKSVPTDFEGTQIPRYSLRSRAKENNPIIPVNPPKPMGDGNRKIEVRRVRKT
ncbi:hypothetical protein NE237_019138 [Protea cynaroides]|uniref:Uncharacterized protein n=1 Tax=Protea cynaroides TaxID=273540 RepID=A0A9Q0QPT7_9MAGN|nr:hypothetical protein NE237_019138 [Protea cynaroides]